MRMPMSRNCASWRRWTSARAIWASVIGGTSEFTVPASGVKLGVVKPGMVTPGLYGFVVMDIRRTYSNTSVKGFFTPSIKKKVEPQRRKGAKLKPKILSADHAD